MSLVFGPTIVSEWITGEGISFESGARVATTVSGTLASSFTAGSSVDGIVLALADRILIKNQSSGVENGMYVVTAGTPDRSDDAQSGASIGGKIYQISEGTSNADTSWTITNNPPTDIIGTDALVMAQITKTGAGSFVSGPASSTVDRIALWNNTSGTLIKTSTTAAIDSSDNISGINTINFLGSDTLTIASAVQTGDATATVPDLGGIAYEFIMSDLTQTMSDKTINTSTIDDPTLTGLGAAIAVNSSMLVLDSGSILTRNIGSGATRIDLTSEVQNTLPIGVGGTGVASTPTNGQVLIGNGTNYTLSTLTAGNGITVNNTAGAISIVGIGYAVTEYTSPSGNPYTYNIPSGAKFLNITMVGGGSGGGGGGGTTSAGAGGTAGMTRFVTIAVDGATTATVSIGAGSAGTAYSAGGTASNSSAGGTTSITINSKLVTAVGAGGSGGGASAGNSGGSGGSGGAATGSSAAGITLGAAGSSTSAGGTSMQLGIAGVAGVNGNAGNAAGTAGISGGASLSQKAYIIGGSGGGGSRGTGVGAGGTGGQCMGGFYIGGTGGTTTTDVAPGGGGGASGLAVGGGGSGNNTGNVAAVGTKGSGGGGGGAGSVGQSAGAAGGNGYMLIEPI